EGQVVAEVPGRGLGAGVRDLGDQIPATGDARPGCGEQRGGAHARVPVRQYPLDLLEVSDRDPGVGPRLLAVPVGGGGYAVAEEVDAVRDVLRAADGERQGAGRGGVLVRLRADHDVQAFARSGRGRHR